MQAAAKDEVTLRIRHVLFVYTLSSPALRSFWPAPPINPLDISCMIHYSVLGRVHIELERLPIIA